MNSKDTKTSRELKREVLDELNKVNNDMNSIQGRLTPGQIIDDALFQPIDRNPRAMFDHLKANPIGTAFLGIGTLLLMEDESHVTYEGRVRKSTSSALENTRYQATLLKGSASNINREMHEKVSGISQKLHGAIDRTKSKVEGLKNKFSQDDQAFSSDSTGEFALGEGGELGASSIDQLKENIGEVSQNISGRVSDFKGKVMDEVDVVKNLDPMTFAAIGAGLGALTGVSLPVSEKEQTLIDQNASGKLNEFSSEFQDAINQAVKVIKDEFIGKFTDFDVSLFGRKQQNADTFRNDI